MNKHLHRIIFNKVRGLFMVVQETASSAGGSAKASAQTGSPEGPGLASGSMTATLSGVRFAVVVSLGMVFAISPLAQAQIAADPNAAGNQRPIVLNTANGLPLVTGGALKIGARSVAVATRRPMAQCLKCMHIEMRLRGKW